jgi:hypothetical protein
MPSGVETEEARASLRWKLAGLTHRGNVERIEDIDVSFFISDDHASPGQKDELLMRNGEFTAVRSADDERAKAVLEPPSDILKIHGEELS